MEIRDATDADWEQIWPFFRTIVTAGETYAYDPEMTSQQARETWFGQPARTVVAVEDGRVIGSATMGPNRPGRGSRIGTASFMVDPAATGRGVGRALGEHVIDWHRAQGFAGIQFNAVVETNTAAVALWRSLGFTIVGTVPGAFRSASHGDVGLHVMFLPLTQSPDRTESRHIGVRIARPAADVYDYAGDPANLPEWARGLGSTVYLVDGQWVAESPMGRVTFAFAPRNDLGVLDHDVTLPDGQVVHNPLRVIADGDSCDVVFTVRRRPGVGDADFERDAAAVEADLAALKQIMERG